MPALSPTMEEGKLAKWLVTEGQAIKPGDIIAEIETDKATMEVEAVDEGKVSKLLVPAGTEGVKVNTPIAVLDGDASAQAHPRVAPRRRKARARPTARRAMPTSSSRCPRSRRLRRARRARDRARHRDGIADHARGAARRHGRGDAARPRRVPDGRGGGAVPGRLQDQPGTARGVRAQTGDRHADHRAGLCRRRRRRGHGRPETDRRVHDLELRHAGDRPDHQLGGQDALYVRRPARLPDRVPRPRTARPPASPPSTASASRPGMRTCPA